MIVGFSEILFDVFPDIFEVDEVKVESEFIFACDHLVSNCICVRTVVIFLVTGLYIFDKTLVEASVALGSQSLVIRFELHNLDY